MDYFIIKIYFRSITKEDSYKQLPISQSKLQNRKTQTSKKIKDLE